MSSVFEGRNVDDALERIHDYVDLSVSGYDTPFGCASMQMMVDVLLELEEKMREHHMNPEETEFPTAKYAVQELQKYLDHQKGNIADATEARIYTRALKADLGGLRRLERDLN